jgi:hypothetical protein
MKKNIEDFGLNAGKIWRVLENNGTLPQNRLIETTKLMAEDFYVAIGWLAREDKIHKNGLMYSLGETNLKDKIGEDAGKIWKILETWGEVDISYIPKLAQINDRDTFCAIGWLAREGKLRTRIIKPNKPQIKFRLK